MAESYKPKYTLAASKEFAAGRQRSLSTPQHNVICLRRDASRGGTGITAALSSSPTRVVELTLAHVGVIISACSPSKETDMLRACEGAAAYSYMPSKELDTLLWLMLQRLPPPEAERAEPAVAAVVAAIVAEQWPEDIKRLAAKTVLKWVVTCVRRVVTDRYLGVSRRDMKRVLWEEQRAAGVVSPARPRSRPALAEQRAERLAALQARVDAAREAVNPEALAAAEAWCAKRQEMLSALLPRVHLTQRQLVEIAFRP